MVRKVAGMKKIIDLLKKYWNIWPSVIISYLIGWLMDFNKSSMDRTTSFLSMFLAILALLTVAKINYSKSKKKTIIEKSIVNQKQVKSIQTAISPLRQGEELYEMLVQTKNIINERKSNKIMKWINENKGAILTMTVGILSLVSTLCSYLIDEWNLVLNVNGFPLIAIIGGSATTIIGCIAMPIRTTTVGVIQNTATKQFKQAKKANASIIKKYDEQIAKFTNKQNELKSDLEDIQVCKDCGLSYDVARLNQLNNEIATLTSNIKKLEDKKKELYN